MIRYLIADLSLRRSPNCNSPSRRINLPNGVQGIVRCRAASLPFGVLARAAVPGEGAQVIYCISWHLVRGCCPWGFWVPRLLWPSSVAHDLQGWVWMAEGGGGRVIVFRCLLGVFGEQLTPFFAVKRRRTGATSAEDAGGDHDSTDNTHHPTGPTLTLLERRWGSTDVDSRLNLG